MPPDDLRSLLSLRNRFNRDVLWNVGSLGVLALGGVVFNVVIASFEGLHALGVFNQVYAIYIFMSQIAVGGVHLSVLKHVSHAVDDEETCVDTVVAALVLSGVLATAVAAATFAASGPLGSLLSSDDVTNGLRLAAPGLVFFSLNKILLNVLNAVRHMRAYAVYQALRLVLILVSIIVILAMDLSAAALPAALTIAEVVLLVVLLVDVNVRVFRLRITPRMSAWFARHASFGVRGLLSGVLSEVNTRVDILMLGFFFEDTLVGVYSIAAIVAEGFGQIVVVVRRNVDPILGRNFAAGDLESITRSARRVRRVMVPVMLSLAVVIALAYPVAYLVVIGPEQMTLSWSVVAILAAGIVLSCGYRPLAGVLLQGGRPGMHTLLVAGVVTANIALNAALIPVLGALGAAIATAAAFVLEAAGILVLARQLFGLRL